MSGMSQESRKVVTMAGFTAAALAALVACICLCNAHVLRKLPTDRRERVRAYAKIQTGGAVEWTIVALICLDLMGVHLNGITVLALLGGIGVVAEFVLLRAGAR